MRTHRLLARFGQERSLRLLLDAYVLDFKTYPEEHATIVPMARPVMSSIGPSLAAAIHDADPSPTRLFERLQKLVPDRIQWASPPLSALRTSLEPRSEKSAQAARLKPTQSDIVKRLKNSDPDTRAEALAAAGYHQLAELFDTVLDVAANGSGVERRAAIYALGFYGRDAPDTLLRDLMVTHDLEIRLSGFELATRKNPARVARESMDVVRAVVTASRERPAVDHSAASRPVFTSANSVAAGPVGRYPRHFWMVSPIRTRRSDRLWIRALALAGNPDAEPALRRLTRHRDVTTRDAAVNVDRSVGSDWPVAQNILTLAGATGDWRNAFEET